MVLARGKYKRGGVKLRSWLGVNTNVVGVKLGSWLGVNTNGVKSINGIQTDSSENRIYNDNNDINYKPEAIKSMYRSPGYKKNQMFLCKNYFLWNSDQHKKHKVCKGSFND